MKHPYGRGDSPLVMGILNLTPDSFSDGGRWTDVDKALEHAQEMVQQGASIIDVGAESTRPGCVPVSSEEEWSRLEPVLRELIPSIDVPVSIDTMKAEVASKCISLGVDIINDVNGFRGDKMFEVCSENDVNIVIGHMPAPQTEVHKVSMGPDFREEIRSFLDVQVGRALEMGIPDDRIIIDPGIGFGKTPEQNMEIVKDLSFLGDGHRILIGVSRKRFVRQYYPDQDVDKASAYLARIVVESGADIVRVHDVALTVSELRL